MTNQPVLQITEITLEMYSTLTGFSVPTLRGRIRDKHWTEGVEYVKNFSGKIVVNIPAAQAWERKPWQDKKAKQDQLLNREESSFCGSGGAIPTETLTQTTGGRSPRVKRRPRTLEPEQRYA